MTSIDKIIYSQLDTLASAWDEQNISSKEILSNLSTALLEGNWLLDFERVEAPDGLTMVSVDGANAKESMQVGDLIVTGASTAEAHRTAKFFESETDIPSEAFVRLLPHRTANDKLMTVVRAAQELIVLENVKDADVRIIDGAYLGSVSEVLVGAAGFDEVLAQIIETELAVGGALSKSLHSLLNPDRNNQGCVIAVVKNDTNTSYANVFKEKFGINVGLMNDRMIADRILKPGQFLAPRFLDSNPQAIDFIRKRIRAGALYENGMKISLMDELVTNNLDQLELLRSTNADTTNEGILWTTYFKPSLWTDSDKAIRIEFPFYRSNSTGETIREFARRMVQLVDQDIFDNNIMEPWCQYAVDVEAKKVSASMRMAKDFLESHVDEESLLRMRSYRT